MSTPTTEWRKLKGYLKVVWSESMGIVIALVVGLLLGIVYKSGDIIDDCRYSGSFRVHSQSFNCQRKI